MGAQVSRSDYEFTTTEEPHKSRRMQILAKYPEVKKLMVVDSQIKYKVLAMVLMQLAAAYFVRDASIFSILVLGYVFGGVVNHSMTLAIHEISHNQAFWNSPLANRLFGMFGNLPMGIPYSTFFKKYHSDHHKYLGDDILDVDIPSRFEARLFRTTGTKLLWLFLQPLFYAFRPLFISPKPITHYEVLNFIIQFAFDALILKFFGWRSLFYLISGTFLAMGIHPMTGHFIAEHYVFTKGYETYSYYGPLNLITFNVGYHNEHHDFPNIPGRHLPKLKEIAAEFYDDLPQYTSWVKVLWEFIWNSDIGPYCRVKRPAITLSNQNGKDD